MAHTNLRRARDRAYSELGQIAADKRQGKHPAAGLTIAETLALKAGVGVGVDVLPERVETHKPRGWRGAT